MIVDPSVVPGLLFLLAELVALAAIGYVIVRVALRETDYRVALAQGLVVGPAIWGVFVNLVMYALPGRAGAVAGWIFVLALAAVLTWRAPAPIRPRGRTVAVFAAAAIALFAVALAGRQMDGIPDWPNHLGLAASIRAGAFPPELPWNPGAPVPYHYGADILAGLLAPPSGPDSAFVEELLGAYAWISLALVVATALLLRASRLAVLIAVPLLVTAGAWTQTGVHGRIILEVPIPTGIPAAGLRASLMDVFWPSVELLQNFFSDALPNIFKPAFTLSYALTLVVLMRGAHAGRRSWLSVTTLAALIGFLGLLSTSLIPIVFVLWTGLEALHLLQSRRAGSARRSDVIRPAAGLALAALLLLAGSLSTLLLGDSAQSEILSLGWKEHAERWWLLGTLDRLPGGVGILGLGPIVIAVAAALLARRDRLVWALAAGTGLLLLASLLLNYGPNPADLARLQGHARNFALFAFVLALGIRLVSLRQARWRYAAGAAFVALVTWPTVAAPVRYAGLAIGNGIDLANAQRTQDTLGTRFVLESIPSDRIAEYIRNNTAIDARVFSPDPHQMTYATGRPNASGFAGLVHLIPSAGPEYLDALSYLEPAAVRRLGFEYVHAPDSWVESLPEAAAQRLDDPNLFELLVRGESESLYRVLPAFLTLDAPPAPASYEALRQAVPASVTVYLLPAEFDTRPVMRTARALSHARLLGVISRELIALLTPWRAEPLGDHVPDFVIAPAQFAPWMFPPGSRQPIWWNDETAVYALDGAVDPITPPLWAEPLPFGVQLSDVHETDGRIAFTATFDNRAPDQWSGQDWIMIATEAPPWNLPTQPLPDGTPSIAMWFSGQIWPGRGTASLAYEFDLLTPSLAIQGSGGTLTPTQASAAESGPGIYTLAVRLRHEYKPNYWRDAAIIPVLRITVSETGEVSYQVHEDVGG